jgi:hypothetical protein
MVLKDINIERELLRTVPSPRKIRSEELFQSFYASLLEINVPIHKLESVTKGGATAMTSKKVGLKYPAFPDIFS